MGATAVSGAPLSRAEVKARLQGFDPYMQRILHDWNGVGFGVGIVVGDELVFAAGYGYRDYGKKLPFDARTLFAIGSNTKLFTTVAAGMLVEEGRLTWDRPVREAVPQIQLYGAELTDAVTLRDMLSHRTGITRHDLVWYDSGFTGKELFDRLRFLEPSAGLRERYLYNNLMYAAAGYIIELRSGIPWDAFVRQRILEPLAMPATAFGVASTLRSASNAAVPYTERQESPGLHPLPLWEAVDAGAMPAGSMVSNLEELSHWLIALMNEGRYAGRQVLPPAVLKATLEPAIPMPNGDNEARGWRELLNPMYGMGRRMAAYRGHPLTYHGGALPGFISQVSYLPVERIGVIAFSIGEHTQPMVNPVTYNVYERLLGLDPTPWSERLLEIRLKEKRASSEARALAGANRVRGTRPSHPLADYVGEYEHPAYGALKISLAEHRLWLEFRKARTALNHYHYDRFDAPGDDYHGKYAVNFSTNPQGDIDRLVTSLDEAEATFVRRPDRLDRHQLERLAGVYDDPADQNLRVAVQPDGSLSLQGAQGSWIALLPYRGLKFRVKEFSDVLYEFVEHDGRIAALKRTDPEGVRVALRH